MDNWEKINETSFQEEENFHSHLKMKYITDADYLHPKSVCKAFKMKTFGEYHDLYIESYVIARS